MLAIDRAREALEGLSVGDALGDGFFRRTLYDQIERFAQEKRMPPGFREYTDDTNMALSVFSILRQFGTIDQDRLARSFAQHFDPARGYGLGMYRMLPQVARGLPWRQLATLLFNGEGSFGNGSAMRIAPLGAYFADDLAQVVEQARLSAEVTHAHPEGIAGAIAAAVAAAIACQLRGQPVPSRAEFIDLVLPHVPDSEVGRRLVWARDQPVEVPVIQVALTVGNGSNISCQDTIPYCLWCAGEHLASYEDAFWLTVSGRGDIDTNCAIVGGIVAGYTGIDGIPQPWRRWREPLPDWAFNEISD